MNTDFTSFIIWIQSPYLNCYIIDVNPFIQHSLDEEIATELIEYYRKSKPFPGMYFPYKINSEYWIKMPIVNVRKHHYNFLINIKN